MTHKLAAPLVWILLLSLPLGVCWAGPGGGRIKMEEKDKGKDKGKEKGEEGEPDDIYGGETSFSKEQANKAIDAGVKWLMKNQGSNGSWGEIRGNQRYGGGLGPTYTHPAGPTALAIYALLKCKVEPSHETIRRGFKYLQRYHKRPRASYETSALLLAVCATAENLKTLAASEKRKQKPRLKGANRRWARELVDHLQDKRVGQAWRYQIDERRTGTPGGENDLSSTQLAALALFAAHRLDLKVKPEVWEGILAYSLSQQEDSGPEATFLDSKTGKSYPGQARGFMYLKGSPERSEGKATGAMTACGLANIAMARFVLSGNGRALEEWNARPDSKRVQQALFDGLLWLQKHWSPFVNPVMEGYHVYYLYGLERAMNLLGGSRIGDHPWYSEMGQELINRQQEAGHWNSRSTHEPMAVLDTCFALLFLKRATADQIPFPSITGPGSEDPPDNR